MLNFLSTFESSENLYSGKPLLYLKCINSEVLKKNQVYIFVYLPLLSLQTGSVFANFYCIDYTVSVHERRECVRVFTFGVDFNFFIYFWVQTTSYASVFLGTYSQ
jgi:hypothetical protein